MPIEKEEGGSMMYGSGRGLGVATGAGGLGLAVTGFPLVGLSLLGLVVILLGFAVVRRTRVRRPESSV